MTGAALDGALTPAGRDWLDAALARIAAAPDAIDALFPAAARHCGRAALPGGGTVDEHARLRLLRALPRDGLAARTTALYRHGDAAEKRAVLRALPALADDLGDAGTDLVLDALRGNDTRLIAAALNPYAAHRLGDRDYRHAILKALFSGLDPGPDAGLDRRYDAELARMVTDFARERVAAGRDVPGAALRLLARADAPPAWLAAELAAADPHRRDAARRARDALDRSR
ncbi:hypothetical protein CLV63_10699 [Murinocardiopsis flavida]|uniref:HEAT repeat protein n=1 Tax=Murinocardiopsis flavida TaxID=645275 RepID=A0A2P8DLL1_9ACTN|nr:EboA domain-containing protein [Murinocardiopsis flavida]PSK98051.1 hypothetical protein CLV63_10699 [Murinocardiopsis flavida]